VVQAGNEDRHRLEAERPEADKLFGRTLHHILASLWSILRNRFGRKFSDKT
jgi:hypothetical protein